MSNRSLTTALFLISGLTATPSVAQIRASERAQVWQTVDGTTIKIDYSRPRARSRNDTLFGGVVKWDEVWTPGANQATTIDVDKDIEVNGQALPKGKYSVWMTVKQEGDWVVIFDTAAGLYHTDHPKERPGQIRFNVTPEARPHLEVLTWSFPEVRSDGTLLVMQWGTVAVPLRIKVQPSHAITLDADLARRYVGAYRLSMKTDSTEHVSDFTIYYEKGSLWAKWDPPLFPEWATLMLIRIADDWFINASLENGEIYDVSSDVVFEFKMDGDRVTGFEVRSTGDETVATATRKR